MSQTAAQADPVLARLPSMSLQPGDAGQVENAAARAQFINFAIGDDQYGVDIMAVREIKGWSDIASLPKQPDYVRGVLNLRGTMVPIVDLRCRFGRGRTEATPMHIVIVVRVGQKTVGLLADRVLDIIDVERNRIQPVPRVAPGSGAGFLAGLVMVESTMIALIDLTSLLSAQADDEDAFTANANSNVS